MLREKFRALILRLNAMWRGDESTVVGIFLSLGGLAATPAGVEAFKAVGIAEDIAKRFAAIVMIFGALLITPKKQ